MDAPTQARIVKSEALPLVNVAGVVNGIDEVVVLLVIHNTENGQLIPHKQRIPEPLDAAGGFGRGYHVIAVLFRFTPPDLWRHVSHNGVKWVSKLGRSS